MAMKRHVLIVLAVLLACLTASSSKAGPGGCTNAASLTPMGFEQITVSSTALGFTSTVAWPAGVKSADLAVVDIETNAIRYRADGVAPTATIGQPVAAAASLTVCGTLSIKAVRFIRQSADATLSVSYYREGDQ